MQCCEVKLRVGGTVSRTVDANSASDGASFIRSYTTKSSRISDAPSRRKFINQEEILDDNPSFTSERQESCKLPHGRICPEVLDELSLYRVGYLVTIDNYEPVCKSKRVPKKRLLDGVLDDGVDDEIRNLEKVKASKVTTLYDIEYKDEYDRGTRNKGITQIN